MLKVRQIGNSLEFENADSDFVRGYFRLDDDLPNILAKISKDVYIKRAARAVWGLRILRQDPWECLISYICATYKNIPAIKQMLDRLSEKFGDSITFEGSTFHAFPEPASLAKARPDKLRSCGLGYRTEYVSKTAKIVASGDFDLQGLKDVDYECAKRELLRLPGVGSKVADCVLLFSLEKLEAFPVDVWVKRAVLKYYSDCFPKKFASKIQIRRSISESDYRRLSCFGQTHFGEYAGYAQEYLYHFERT